MKSLLILSLILLFSYAFSADSSSGKTHVVVVFDVEDYTTPEMEGIDEIPKWLAEIMSEEGVTGTFFVIGEKARWLEKRGRKDVIQAMARHDIGSHTLRGSIHPTVTEQLETANWNEGVRTMLQQESEGFKMLRRIFKKKIVTLARHGGSYGPQLIYALGLMKAGYVYSPIHLPGKNAVWFCNALNFHGDYAGFDDTYYRDDLFEPVFDSLKVQFKEAVGNADVVSFFACHPCKVRTVQFWDFNYYYGENPDSTRWKTPELRPLESMETAKKNFRRLMQFLKSRDDIELTTYSGLMKRFSHQKKYIRREELVDIARRVLSENAVIISDDFSPAETFAALSASIARYYEKKSLPGRLRRTSPLGPMALPDSVREPFTIPFEEACRLALEADRYIRSHRFLPSALDAGGKSASTGPLYALFCRMYLDISNGAVPPEYTIGPFDPYPKTNEQAIIRDVEDCRTWPVHRRDLDMTGLVEMTRMQLWTLKPAREKP